MSLRRAGHVASERRLPTPGQLPPTRPALPLKGEKEGEREREREKDPRSGSPLFNLLSSTVLPKFAVPPTVVLSVSP